jgi:hypothetical protein
MGVAVASVLLGGNQAEASVNISYNSIPVIYSDYTDWTASLAFPKFNTALGTLEQATITIDAVLASDLSFENKLDSKTQTIAYGYYLDLSTSEPKFSNLGINYNTGFVFSNTLAKKPLPGYSVNVSINNPSAVSHVYTDAATLNLLKGSGNYDMEFNASAAVLLGNLGGNFKFEQTTTASVSGKIVYQYTPVPEPSTYIAGLGALALFGFTSMPRRKRVS